MAELDEVFRSAVARTRGEQLLATDPTQALRQAERALALWPDNPDAEAVLVRAAHAGGFYQAFHVEGFVREIAFARGKLLIGADVLTCFDLDTGIQEWAVDPPSDAVRWLLVTENAVWAGMLFGEIRQLDLADGSFAEPLVELPGTIEFLAEAPDGGLHAVGGGTSAHIALDGTVTTLLELDPESGPDETVIFPNRTVVSVKKRAATLHGDPDRRLLEIVGLSAHPSRNLALGRREHGPALAFTDEEVTGRRPSTVQASITALRWSPADEMFAAGDAQGRVVVDTGPNVGDVEESYGIGERVVHLRFSDDGTQFAAVGARAPVRVFDRTRRPCTEPLLRHRHYNQRFIAIDGPRIAMSNHAVIELYDTPSSERRELHGHEGAALRLQFHDGVLYSAGDDCTIRAWDLETGASRIWTEYGPHVEEWKDEGWKDGVHTMSKNSSSMGFVRVGERNRLLLSGCPGGPLQIWSLDGDDPVDALAADPIGSGPRPDRRDRIEEAFWLDDERFVARDRFRAYVGAVGKGWSHRFDSDGRIFGLIAHPASERIATRHNRILHVWSTDTGERLRTIELPLAVQSVAFCPDGTLLCLGQLPDEKAFFRVHPDGRMDRLPYPFSSGPSWFAFEDGGDTAFLTIDRKGLYRIPVTGAGALAMAEHAATAADLGL